MGRDTAAPVCWALSTRWEERVTTASVRPSRSLRMSAEEPSACRTEVSLEPSGFSVVLTVEPSAAFSVVVTVPSFCMVCR